MARLTDKIRPLIIYVDIDNTICETNGTDYADARPIKKMIAGVNRLYDLGHGIVYYTARGATQGVDYSAMTFDQLAGWGCRFSKLRMDKPVFDLIVDDRAIVPYSVIDGRKLPLWIRRHNPW